MPALPPDFRRNLERILAIPTAPFFEGLVHAAIREAVAASPRLRGRVDRDGNLLVTYGPGRPRLLFACHTDHPALEARGDGTAVIRGGIRPAALRDTRLRRLDRPGRVATVGAVVRGSRDAVRLKGGKGLRRGTPLVLDLEGPRFTGGKIRAVAVDDLCAVAACLTLLDRLAAASWRGTVGVLFTRAEEVGFAGALAWIRRSRLPKSTTIINLEMSPARPHTPQGAGPILRVGDKVTTFIQGVAVELDWAARALQKDEPDFRFQRALMDGGACEATVYTFGGFRSGALCLPLKNYHNHAARGGMGLEYVDAADAADLVRWMEAYTRGFGKKSPREQVLGRLDRLYRKNRRRLEASARQGRGP